MAITGELWTGLYTGDSTRIRKWLYGSILIRDWKPDGSTSLANFTPFETDGSITATLLSPSMPGGQFYELGALTEDGVELNPKFSVDETKIWQDRRSQRTDVTEDDEEIMFTCVESTPVIDLLRNNLPLSNMASIGSTDYTITKPLTTDTIYRQIVIIGVDGPQANAEYIAEIRPRVSITKQGKRQFAAKKADGFEFTFGVYPDPASGFSARTKRNGPAWTQAGGPVVWPTPQVAPVATAGATGAASIVLQQPVSNNGPFSYTVKTGTGTTVTVGSQTTNSSGVVTIGVTGVASGATTFIVTATSADGAFAASSPSNSVTIT